MRRRDLLLASFAQPDDFGLRLINALRDMQELALSYFGCTSDATAITEEQCRQHRANLDRRKYSRARASSAKLFDFKEKS